MKNHNPNCLRELGSQSIDRLIECWSTRTEVHEPAPLSVTPTQLRDEAQLLAHLVEENWASREVNGQVRIGLDALVKRGGITPGLAQEMRQLALVISEVERQLNAQTSESGRLENGQLLQRLVISLNARIQRSSRALRYVFSQDQNLIEQLNSVQSTTPDDPGAEPTLEMPGANPWK